MDKEVFEMKYYIIVDYGSEGCTIDDFDTIEKADEYINDHRYASSMRAIKGVELKIGVTERIIEEE